MRRLDESIQSLINHSLTLGFSADEVLDVLRVVRQGTAGTFSALVFWAVEPVFVVWEHRFERVDGRDLVPFLTIRLPP